jgi:tetratricopeptide (TPR) repeat protein
VSPSYTGAIEYYDKALAINPKYEDALNNKGNALDNLGNHTGAILYYNKALAINPKYEDALNNKGKALDDLRNYTGAILYYDKALAIQPNDTYALDNKGAVLNTLGNYTGAILYYDKTLAIDPKNTFALTNKAAILDILRNNTTSVSTYENRNYGIQIQYPSDWSVQESKSSGEPINIATFLSPTGNPYPTAAVAIYIDRLHNSVTNLNNYAHFVAFTDYENRPSYFHAFRLLELNTNSSILAGRSAYTLIGTYELPSIGLQKLMEIGTIIGDKVYSVQYIVDAPKYSDYLPCFSHRC